MSTRIVIIDNDEPTRESLITGIDISATNKDWQVSGYAYAQIGMTALENLHPDLIILDFNIRDGGLGWEFLQMLKMDDAMAHTPILITTTAIRLSTEIEDYLLTRYIQVIYKPYDLDSLVLLIQQTIVLASQTEVLYSSDRPLSILVVEDSAELQESLTLILRLEGYQVVTADNGMFALDALYKTDHCLILLDIRMPVMDGIEFLRVYDRQLRPHSPVVVLSGEADLSTHVFPAFVIGILPKPYDINHLLHIVKRYAQPA